LADASALALGWRFQFSRAIFWPTHRPGAGYHVNRRDRDGTLEAARVGEQPQSGLRFKSLPPRFNVPLAC
jgi:hypothetical protein